jgi:hypothetical protein
MWRNGLAHEAGQSFTKCQRGPLDRVLSRLIGKRLIYTNYSMHWTCRQMQQADRRESRLIMRHAALAEAGQDPMKSALYDGFELFSVIVTPAVSCHGVFS